MKVPKNKDFDKCMRTVIDKCGDSDSWTDNSLREYCNDSVQKASLRVLETNGYIRLISTDDSTIYAVLMLERGYQYFAEKESERNEFLKGFFSQFLTGFLSGALVAAVSTFLLTK